jgi:glucose/arabinose dehydrogenase
MPRSLLAFLLLVAACSPDAEPVTTTTPTTTAPVETTSSTSTTTTEPETTTTLPPLRALAYQLVVDIDFPVQLTSLPGSDTSYLITKDGRVWRLDGDVLVDTPVLDISSRVLNQGEQGLLSVVLHPDDIRRLFLHYSATDGDTVVAEYTFDDSGVLDQDSERILLRLDQPAGNHNGGMIQFGPDGALYLGLGDGGGANDQFGHGQNPDSLLGGLVSLNVDGDPDPTLFAMGLRNPWRFWLDGDLIYVADVGQNSFEEVSVTHFEPGLNFGWPITEGLHCFNPPSGCDTTGLTLPVVEVRHGDGDTCSITGGPVYRGSEIPEIVGHYFYSDYCGGYLRSFRHDGGAVDETDWTEQTGVPGRVVGFGVDGHGEMYVATTEALFKVVAIRE